MSDWALIIGKVMAQVAQIEAPINAAQKVSSGATSATKGYIADCDLIIDATADPAVFKSG